MAFCVLGSKSDGYTECRKQPEALAKLQARPSAMFLPVCGEDSAVLLPADAPSDTFLNRSQVSPCSLCQHFPCTIKRARPES